MQTLNNDIEAVQLLIDLRGLKSELLKELGEAEAAIKELLGDQDAGVVDDHLVLTWTAGADREVIDTKQLVADLGGRSALGDYVVTKKGARSLRIVAGAADVLADARHKRGLRAAA